MPESEIAHGFKVHHIWHITIGFQDYFQQMGEMTGHNCVKRLACISTSEELRSVFLHSMTRADARRV
jgi:hypothetical protein